MYLWPLPEEGGQSLLRPGESQGAFESSSLSFVFPGFRLSVCPPVSVRGLGKEPSDAGVDLVRS